MAKTNNSNIISVRILKKYEYVKEYINEIDNKNQFINEAIDFYIKYKKGELEAINNIDRKVEEILEILKNGQIAISSISPSEKALETKQSEQDDKYEEEKKNFEKNFTRCISALFDDDED